jgi:mono/diheme cytochrome c family protein
MHRMPMVVAMLVLMAGPTLAGDPPEIYDQKCKSCHSIGGVGGPMAKFGGPLDGVGSKRDEEWLRAYFADPKSKIADSKMPKLNLPEAEWDTLVQYMLSLK